MKVERMSFALLYHVYCAYFGNKVSLEFKSVGYKYLANELESSVGCICLIQV